MAEKTAEPQSAQAAHQGTPAGLAASQLSALIDGELPEAEQNLVLRRLSRDSEAQGRWERYHLISDAMQGHLPVRFDAGFAARLREAIDREPAPQSRVSTLPAWYKPLTGFALAASVVLAVLFGLRLTDPNPGGAAPTLAAAPASYPALALQGPNPPPASASNSYEPPEAQLNNYLVNHNGYASRNSVNGMLPYVRLVGYQTAR